MNYTWQNGEVITAEKLNQTGGTAVVITPEFSETVSRCEWNLKKSYNELKALLEAGNTILLNLDCSVLPVYTGWSDSGEKLTFGYLDHNDNDGYSLIEMSGNFYFSAQTATDELVQYWSAEM